MADKKTVRLPRDQRVPPAQRPPMRLTERDIDIVQAVSDHRALLGSHIQDLFFGSRSTAQYRLSRLFHHEYLDRHFMTVVSGGPASSPIIYTIGRHGERMLAEQRGYTPSELRRPKGGTLSWNFLEHLLRINDFRVDVTLAARTKGWTVEVWEDEPLFRANPDYVWLNNSQGRLSKKPVLPDGYFRLAVPQGRAHFFVEVDRGSESLSRFRPQVEVYQAYTASGQYQVRYSKTSLRVLVITTSARRMASLKMATREAGGDRKYWFTTFDLVTPETVLTGAVWERLMDDTPYSLIESVDSGAGGDYE